MGRPRLNFSFEEARMIVREEGLSSVRQYEKWYAMNQPARLPKRPDRAYEREWISWNDFLGSNNPFPCVRKKFRPYNEARSFAHKLNLKNKLEWIEYAKSDKKPADIPSRPDVFYQKSGLWYTWKDFLGYNAMDKMNAVNEASIVLYVIKYDDTPSNVFTFGTTDGGKSSIIEKQKTSNFRIIKIYDISPQYSWKPIVERMCKEHHGYRSNEYVSYNIYDVLYELENSNEIQESF